MLLSLAGGKDAAVISRRKNVSEREMYLIVPRQDVLAIIVVRERAVHVVFSLPLV